MKYIVELSYGFMSPQFLSKTANLIFIVNYILMHENMMKYHVTEEKILPQCGFSGW